MATRFGYKIHSMRKKYPKDYYCWNGFLQRCYNPNNKDYSKYGGRGIGVCERWRHSYSNFHEDMGTPDPCMSLDRIDVNGDYSPENCRWATSKEQAANRRKNVFVELKGVRMIASEAAIQLGIPKDQVYYLLKRGCPPDQIDDPLAFEKTNGRKKFEFEGRRWSLKEYCREKGYNYMQLHSRRKRGAPMEKWLSP